MSNPDLKPKGDRASFKFREARIMELAGYYFDYNKSPFMDPENTREIFAGTQFGDENHRRHTPHLQTLFTMQRQQTMKQLDALCSRPQVLESMYDVIIIGTGPHGAAVASYIREMRPKATILMLDNGKIGGQFRSYGDRPSFFMNSRVRKADRTLPNLPRTEGSINPLGQYAPLELSDVATSLYPSNTDMGDITALNCYMSANTCLPDVNVLGVDFNYDNNNGGKLVLAQREGRDLKFYGKYVVDATGMRMGTKLGFEGGKPPDRLEYFTGPSFYRHFGTHANPLKMFHGAKVMVVGGGDTALTVLEALIGQLPGSSYGMGGAGRYRPKEIAWWGAPRGGVEDLKKCLRSRYRNGIPQALSRAGSGSGVIRALRSQVSGVYSPSGYFFEVVGVDNDSGQNIYEYPNILVDCTRKAISRGNGWQVDYRVGPENGGTFSQTIQRVVSELKIPENNVSLWATMEQTNQFSEALVGRL